MRRSGGCDGQDFGHHRRVHEHAQAIWRGHCQLPGAAPPRGRHEDAAGAGPLHELLRQPQAQCTRTGTPRGHGPQQPIAITFTDKSHPVTTGLADWTTINEELYNNVQILGAKTLATGLQKVPEKKDKKGKVTPASEANATVAWTNEFGPKKTRIFSTTIGHNNATVEDARYLDLVARAVLWSVDKLDAEGKPAAGYGAKK